ncbi:MAG: hypothetical protein ACI4LK_08395 [Lentihominibacter sp.]
MILFKKREKNVNTETVKEEKMTETERKMAELGAAAYFEYLEMCFEDDDAAEVLTGYIYALKAVRHESDDDAFMFVKNLLRDKGVTEFSPILTEMCGEREDLLKTFLDKFEALGIRYIVNLMFEDEDEKDDDEECECGSSCEGCGECNECNESNARGSEYEYLDEGELCYLTFNFDIGNVNINGTITMIEDDEEDDSDE